MVSATYNFFHNGSLDEIFRKIPLISHCIWPSKSCIYELRCTWQTAIFIKLLLPLNWGYMTTAGLDNMASVHITLFKIHITPLRVDIHSVV
jgi:hypothetical protein